MKTACVILAAGLGKRMNSRVPKVLHPLCGAPMLQHVLNAAKKLAPDSIVVVAGTHKDLIEQTLAPDGIEYIIQKEAKGTGHALLCAMPALRGYKGTIIVLNGDAPLVTHASIRKFIGLHNRHRAAVSVLSFTAKDPSNYGRIVRDDRGRFISITEEKDTDQKTRAISEVNSGVYAISHEALPLLNRLEINTKKGEYYLTDIVAAAFGRGMKTSAYCIGSEKEFMGVNTREELYMASVHMRERIVREWADKGVNFIDRGSVYIQHGVSIGQDSTIYPNVHLEGTTRIGQGSTIYPNVRIINSAVGNHSVILDCSVIEASRIKDRASVGPFARLRPGSEVGTGAKIGNFVELKKSVVGDLSKASHLSYIGDTRIGKGVNIGAGTITCNYDGEKKHNTVIGDGVFVGSDTQLVAPVRIGKGAYIGAGSTITKDIPAGALAISRVGQKNIKGWAGKKALTGKHKDKK